MIKYFRLFPFLVLISGICFYPETSVFADGENDKSENEIEINISPKDNLFDISNMKPGDWAPRTITVQNSGSTDFVYHLQLENSGDKKLFNELLLEIKAGDKELYQGKLAALESLPERKLTSSSKENLDITIRFPEHLGNDFQGLKSAFVFSFTAEGTNSTAVQAMIKGQVASSSIGPTSTGFSLPTMSTNIFNLMLFGTLLVAGGIVIIIRHYKRIKMSQKNPNVL